MVVGKRRGGWQGTLDWLFSSAHRSIRWCRSWTHSSGVRLVEGSVGPINIVRGVSVSLKEIVQLLIRLVGNDIKIKFLLDKPNGSSLRFDNGLMIKSFGKWPLTSLEEGIAREVEAFRRGEGGRH